MKAKAIAHPNIALVKYWGKRDQKLNLPAVGSISITLKEMYTITSVEFLEKLKQDVLILNGKEANQKQLNRVSSFLDIIRNEAGFDYKAKTISENNFPTGAGLASSASAFASLALAGTEAAQLSYTKTELSELARRGSGSAPRSIFGGFVEMKTGELSNGSDAVAIQLADEHHWDIKIMVIITSENYKTVSSTNGMTLTAKTSPFYEQWVISSQNDLNAMRDAILNRNFSKLGELAEFSCLKMHAVALSANPGIIYWNPITIKCIELIRKMRQEGIPVYFTIDAGPQVKAICLPQYLESIKLELSKIDGINKIITTSLGSGAIIMEE